MSLKPDPDFDKAGDLVVRNLDFQQDLFKQVRTRATVLLAGVTTSLAILLRPSETKVEYSSWFFAAVFLTLIESVVAIWLLSPSWKVRFEFDPIIILDDSYDTGDSFDTLFLRSAQDAQLENKVTLERMHFLLGFGLVILLPMLLLWIVALNQ